MDVRGKVISADCHVDLIWLPPDLFTDGAPAHLKERMPYVSQDDQGRDVWVSRGGAYFGLKNGMGSAGREYVPGVIHRSDRMAAQGLYEDGAKGIRRLTEPELRVRDQDLDGVRGEVLYGILGAANRLNDPEAAVEVMRIYNEWLADFCETQPGSFRRHRLHPEPRHRRGGRRDRAGREARRRPRSRDREHLRHDAALSRPLEPAVGGRGRERTPGAHPHHRREDA